MGGMKAVVDETTDTAATSTKTTVRSNEGSRPEVIKGKLDLSRKGYGKLSLRYKDAYSAVKFLDLSHNNFKFINGLNLFVSCVELHASHNCLERLSSFLSLRNVMKVLDVSDNVIGNAEHLASLSALVSIDLSNNRIAELCLLDRLTHLTVLNLSSNRLHSLPRLHRLSHLEVLNLNANAISSLNDCQRQLPRNLKSLDVGSNDISDLRQAEYLSGLERIDSLVWAGNPCVRSDCRTFTYRPFLYSCCYTSLRVVDGYSLQEAEIIKGELLCTMSKVRRAQTHAELCSILTKHCPIDVDLCDTSSLSFDERLFKVMEKRREYLSTTATDDSSVSLLDHCGREANHRKQPQLCDPSLSIDLTADGISEDVSSDASLCTAIPSTSATLIPGSSSPPPSASSVTSSSTFVLSHQESHTESISVAKIVQRADSAGARQVSNPENHKTKPSGGAAQRPLRSPRTCSVRGCARRSWTTNKRSSYSAGTEKDATTDVIPTKSSEKKRERTTRARRGSTNARGDVVSRGRGRTQSGKAPSIKYSLAHIQAAIHIQAWWRAFRVQRVWRLRLLEARVQRYQKNIRELNSKRLQSDEQLMALGAQCEQLSTIVEQQSNWMAEVTDFVMTAQRKTESQMAELSANMRRIMPTPSGLQCTRVSPSAVTVQWDDVQQKGYALFVNGRECGVIRAPLRKGCVQDLDPTKHSTIEVQCVCGELRGQRSSPLIIPPITEVIRNGESIEEDGEPIERKEIGLEGNADDLVDVDNVQSDHFADRSPLQPGTSHQSPHTHIDAQ